MKQWPTIFPHSFREGKIAAQHRRPILFLLLKCSKHFKADYVQVQMMKKKIQNVNVFIISSINSIFGTGKFPSYSWTVARKYHRNELTFHMFLHAKREDIRPHLDWNVKIAASFLLASEIAFPPIECWWEEKNVPQFTLIKFRNWIAFDLECWLLFFTTAISCVTGAAFAAVLFIKYEMFEN